MQKIPLIKPYITQEVKDKVNDVLSSGYLTEGPVTKEFEEAVRSYIDCRHAIAVCNCTVGLETALRAMGIGPGDEVIVPDYTYPATASAVGIVGATIVIVDVDPDTMLSDYDAIENAVTKRTKAIMPVSIFGNPLDYGRLQRIKEKYNLCIIEDAACALGARYKGSCVGKLADISVFSLHPRKFITTGEGGIITTNNSDLADWIESYKHFGSITSTSRSTTQFERIGTNYKLSNVLAAIGLVQMKYIDSLFKKRTRMAIRYIEMLNNKPGVRLPQITRDGVHSWQSFCIYVHNRDKVIDNMREKNIEVQIGTYALHMHRAFYSNPNCRITGKMAGSRYAFDHCLTLPLFHDMTPEQQETVVDQL